MDHYELSHKPVKFLLITDRSVGQEWLSVQPSIPPLLARRFMIIERRILVEGWKSIIKLKYRKIAKDALVANNTVYISSHDPIKVSVMPNNSDKSRKYIPLVRL